jgi:hypothetical protein
VTSNWSFAGLIPWGAKQQRPSRCTCLPLTPATDKRSCTCISSTLRMQALSNVVLL